MITAKHHKGFCLFDSQFTDFDVMNGSYCRDIPKELSEAYRRYGLKLGSADHLLALLAWGMVEPLADFGGDFFQ